MKNKILALLDAEAKKYATSCLTNRVSENQDEKDDAELDGQISVYIRFHLMPKVEKLAEV